MNRIYNPIVVLCAGFLFATTTTTTIMSNNSRMFLRCHAFVSNANKQYKLHSRGVNAWRLEYKNNYHLVVRGGGSGFFSSSENNKETRTTTTRLSSTTSPLRESSSVSESDEFEKRVLESISIASGGTRPTSIKSFGGLKYQDVSSSSDNNNKSSLFRVVFVLGGPGAGKGTQCELLIDNYPCHHLSAGQLLRDEAQKKDGSSEHADLIEECLVAGKIVPVEISLSLLRNAMQEAEGNDSLIFLIDGFPRNFDNLEGWTRCMTRNYDDDDVAQNNDAAAVWGVLSYDCPLSILEERVMKRSKDSGRSDDNLESLRRRFKTFQGETQPVVETLRAIDEKTDSLLRVVDIEGQRSLEEVWEETQKSMNSFISNDVLSANMKLLEAIAKKDVGTYRSLSADEMFSDEGENNTESAVIVMEAQETERDNLFNDINVEDAEITFITGKKASVSYTRKSDSGVTFRETRVWSHQGPKGWRQVHFFRSE